MRRRLSSGTITVLLVGGVLVSAGLYGVIATALTSSHPWSEVPRALLWLVLMLGGLVLGARSAHRDDRTQRR